MDRKGKRFLLSVLSFLIIAIMLTGWVMQAQSQEKYPTRGIDLICPFAPGGTTDLWSRITADFLKKKWGVPINVINKTGGGSVPANLEVYRAAPDGYTMLADCQASCSFLEVGIKDLPFKVMDRTFVSGLAASPSVIICNAKSSWKNLKDAEVDAKKDPETFTWASTGSAGTSDFLQRQFFKAIGVDIGKTKPIITRGMGEANTLIAGGHIKFGSDAAATAYSHVKGGLVKALAITYEFRSLYPDLSTTAEQGYPTVSAVWWFGFSGPPKLPSYVVNKWEEGLQQILKDPEFVSKIKSGGIILYRNAHELREHVRGEMEQAAELWGVK
jgi:tripartite-type tricarboxylate transporter receptor subunit TctC